MTHPGIERIRSLLADSGLDAATIQEQRASMAAMASGAAAPEGISVRSGTLGGVPAEWLTPVGVETDATVLYLHGGGYCIGSLDTHRPMASRIAAATGCTVITLDYRLAPEDPFPAALDDAVGAYRELLASGARPERTAIAGDSAGGGLTVATLLALRAERDPLPAAGVCLSPWVDLTQTAPSFDALAAVDPMVSRAGLHVMASAYLGSVDPRTPLASPLFAEDFGGLPPVRIEVGECEVLLDDSTRLAERIEAAGGEVSLTVWPELIHVFQAFAGPLVPEAQESIDAIGAFLAQHLALSGPEAHA
jgi:epsilon-lactone hydrolase